MTMFGGRRKSAPGILIAAVAGFSLLATTAANAVITTTNDAVAFASAVTTAPPGHVRRLHVRRGRRRPPRRSTRPTARRASRHPAGRLPDAGAHLRHPHDRQRGPSPTTPTSGAPSEDWLVAHDEPTMGPRSTTGTPTAFDLAAATDLAAWRSTSSSSPTSTPSTSTAVTTTPSSPSWASPAITVDPTTGAVNAPGNFAAGAGDMISVDSLRSQRDQRGAGAGTTYDGATPS